MASALQDTITLLSARGASISIPIVANTGIPGFNISSRQVLVDNAQPGVVQTRDVTFENCSAQPVQFNASLDASSAPIFSLPSTEVVGTLDPGMSQTLTLTASPSDGMTDARGTLSVLTDLPVASDFSLALFSDAASAACPEVLLEGEVLDGNGGVFTGSAVVSPQTRVRLVAQVMSNLAGGDVTYRWATLNEPEGGSTRAVVNRTRDNVLIVTPPTQGIYTFRLDIVNRLGVSACTPAERQLDVFTPRLRCAHALARLQR